MSKAGKDEPVTVATFGDMMEAEIACGALNAAGIPAEIPKEGMHLQRPRMFSPALEIRVFRRDRDAAIKILQEAKHR